MSNRSKRERGNGCFFGLIGIGVLMIGAAGAIELVSDLEFPNSPPSVVEDVPNRGFVMPDQPTRADDPLLYTDPPPSVAPDEPEPTPEPAAGGHTLLWHAETLDSPPVPCILRIGVTSGYDPTDVNVVCAGGRSVSSHPYQGDVSGIGTRDGARFRASINPTPATDDAGNQVVLGVDPGNHRITIVGAPTTMPAALFVEELSVPDPRIGDFRQREVTARFVRLAVPTLVTGPIPTAIAMVRATGGTPRAGDPVCELSGGPNPDSSYNCRLLLRCGGEVIYGLGNTGYNNCTVTNANIIGARDTGTTAENSDPRVDLDMNEGRLIISDATPQGEWFVTFDLVPDPRYQNDRHFAGTHLTREGSSAFLLSLGAVPAISIGGTPRPISNMAVDVSGGVRIGDDPYDSELPPNFFLGRGGRALAGYLDGDAVWAFAE